MRAPEYFTPKGAEPVGRMIAATVKRTNELLGANKDILGLRGIRLRATNVVLAQRRALIDHEKSPDFAVRVTNPRDANRGGFEVRKGGLHIATVLFNHPLDGETGRREAGVRIYHANGFEGNLSERPFVKPAVAALEQALRETVKDNLPILPPIRKTFMEDLPQTKIVLDARTWINNALYAGYPKPSTSTREQTPSKLRALNTTFRRAERSGRPKPLTRA